MAKSQKRTGREPKKPKAPAKKIVIVPPVQDESRQSPKKKPSAAPRA
ncbi:hypothetical protein [Magnetospirillum gryphiswaldense]|uniref:Uncharacterized protein n=1 Tax=Magnetospirillum gryphiswaldense (strain DSM 6361 / JCM 21280 / NBRC 15271 / MSR-1) TaxID=431944 RepID=V6F323_MAGGM|nr:hypothetical protein [Magnetospirillum gryphiswaldense]AVM74089.1 hypothetical protein MSR1_15970 [Magnetospirillum gryphiswaldense MSR-1]AVM77992.1 hypothetical protein MSR1L_15970 [Magnetospirillum gryphiswaldense]CDK98878.1 protein of unknown function [Magnetospirillum gryphiswaldense MSR-1 v2]